jgi:hypothetical protein
MTDPKDFLSRWSQRKLNPETEQPAPQQKTWSPADKNAAASSAADQEFDISTLPSLESIGANSDVRAFLQRGVPVGLTRAALRRAWSADPAIRDFVGLSENSWDFNAPESIPGFGALDTAEVRRIAAQFFGEPATETTKQAAQEDGKSDQISAETRQTGSELDKKTESGPDADPTSAPEQQRPADIAMRDEKQSQPEISSPAPRRHGGALPE